VTLELDDEERGARAWASEDRVIRGGSFNNPARNARSAYRNRNHRSNRWNDLGFRPAQPVAMPDRRRFANAIRGMPPLRT